MTVTTTTIIIITLHNRLMASTVADKCIISKQLTPFTLMIWDIGDVRRRRQIRYNQTENIKRKKRETFKNKSISITEKKAKRVNNFRIK